MSAHSRYFVISTTCLLFSAVQVAAADGQPATTPTTQAMPADCPMHAEHMAVAENKSPAVVDAGLTARGERAMGFSQAAATHHFVLQPAGGEIRLEANNAQDVATRDQIRDHLVKVARSFAAGNFEIPMAVHNQIAPGVPALERLRATVTYSYSDTERGGRVQLQTSDAQALKAIHEFLTFQIEEHRTGDPLTTSGN